MRISVTLCYELNQNVSQPGDGLLEQKVLWLNLVQPYFISKLDGEHIDAILEKPRIKLRKKQPKGGGMCVRVALFLIYVPWRSMLFIVCGEFAVNGIQHSFSQLWLQWRFGFFLLIDALFSFVQHRSSSVDVLCEILMCQFHASKAKPLFELSYQ